MPFSKQDRSRFPRPPNMTPDAIQTDNMSKSPPLGTLSPKKASRGTTWVEDGADEEDEDGFLVLNAPAELSVVDVYLGEEIALVQLPAKLARGMAALVVQTPAKRTVHTPADNALWQTLDLNGWWDEIVKTETVSGGKNRAYHVTESLSLPEIGLDRFNTFKEWVKRKWS